MMMNRWQMNQTVTRYAPEPAWVEMFWRALFCASCVLALWLLLK